jgi:hypothetical protein
MAEKKEETKINYAEWNIFKKLAKARVLIRGMMGTKSGFNKYANYRYFELEDIIPPMLKVFDEIGLVGIEGHEDATIHPDTGIQLKPEFYTLKIYNTDNLNDKPIIFTKKYADAATKGQLPIQAVGSESTYMRRYLWLDALEIVENDATDAVARSGEQAEAVPAKPRMASAAQIKILKTAFPDPTAVFQWAQVSRWEDLTAEIASQIIARKRLGQKEGSIDLSGTV